MLGTIDGVFTNGFEPKNRRKRFISVGTQNKNRSRVRHFQNCHHLFLVLLSLSKSGPVPAAFGMILPAFTAHSGHRSHPVVELLTMPSFHVAIASLSDFPQGLMHASDIAGRQLWKPGEQPAPAPEGKGMGRPPRLLRRDGEHQPATVKDLALSLAQDAWKTVCWGTGVKGSLESRFAALRVRFHAFPISGQKQTRAICFERNDPA